jgi:hypothetical protein
MEEEKYFVSLGMRTYGGGFVKSLGTALARADVSNTRKIKQAFPEYWETYHELGKQRHKKTE